MNRFNHSETLQQRIYFLKQEQALALDDLQKQLRISYEYLQPANLIKNTFHSVVESPDLKMSLLSTAVGLASGYLSKRLFVGPSHSPVKKLLGFILQYAMTKLVAKETENVVS